MEVTVDITPDDYWHFNKVYMRSHFAEKRLPMKVLLMLGGVAVLLSGLLSLLRGDLGWISELAGSSVGSVLGGLLLLAGLCVVLLVFVFFMTRRYVRNQGSKDTGATGEHHLRIAADGIHEKTTNSEGTHSWDAVTDVTQNRDYIYVFLGKARAHIIPKRAFRNGSEAETFFARCRELWQPPS